MHKELFKTVSTIQKNELNIQSIISSYELSNVVRGLYLWSLWTVCNIKIKRDLIVGSKINEKSMKTTLIKA